jgi:hypothetical protein
VLDFSSVDARRRAFNARSVSEEYVSYVLELGIDAR